MSGRRIGLTAAPDATRSDPVEFSSAKSVESMFIEQLGAMAGPWGVSRSVAQTFGMLFLAERPLTADELVERLQFSRSNVSMAIKELTAWRLISVRHLSGDRKERYSTPRDAATVATIIAQERYRREIEPFVAALREMERNAAATDSLAPFARARIREMFELSVLVQRSSSVIIATMPTSLRALFRLGTRMFDRMQR